MMYANSIRRRKSYSATDIANKAMACIGQGLCAATTKVSPSFAKPYSDAVDALALTMHSRLKDAMDKQILDAMERQINPPIMFDPAAPATATKAKLDDKDGLTYAKLKEIHDKFIASGSDTVKFFDPRVLQMWLEDAVTRPGTKFVGNVEDIYTNGRSDRHGWEIVINKKTSQPYPMGPWNILKDDRVLGATGNSADCGAEGDEFMGDVSRILTPEFRVSFPKVFKAEAFQEGQDPKYSIVMLFPKKMAPEMQKRFDAMKALAAATARAKWGDKMPKNLRSPFRDGAEKDLPGYEDVIFVSASSKVKPGLVNEDAEPMLNPEDFYPGCYAHAYVTCYAYDTAGNRGVAFGLSTIQKLKNGEPFAPRNNAQDDFAPVTPVAGEAGAAANDDIENLFGN